MASKGQSIVVTYVAWDTVNNVGKTGDVANHTLRWIKDGTSSAPTNTATEVDVTNAPGIYKITLTTDECTCNSGTLAGKSSTANISIMPKDVTFEQLPTASPGSTNGLGILSATGAIPSNITQIDGELTIGNNATLNLKKLNVINDNGNAIVAESTGGDGNGIYAHGSTKDSAGILAKGGSSDGTSGTGIAAVSGDTFLVSTGNGLLCVGGASGNGIFAIGPNGIVANGSNNGGRNDFVGDLVGNVVGSVVSVGTLRPVKNVGYSNFMFPMFDSSTKSPKSGLSVASQRAIDGNPFSPCTNTVAEIGDGVYRINLSASDMNGDKVMLRFTANGADDQLIEILTQG